MSITQKYLQKSTGGNGDGPIKKDKQSIIKDVVGELREGAEDIDLVKVDLQGLASMIDEYEILMFSDAKYTVKGMLKSIIKEQKSTNSLFIVDINAIFRRYKLWMKNLPNIEIFYAVKCNPDTVIIRTLADLGAGFDVASKEEISMIENLDIPRDMIIFANPVKEESHITHAELENVHMMTFDNLSELDKIVLYYPRAKLVLRILVDDSKSKIPFGSKFGCPKENIKKLFYYAQIRKLKIIGVSFHVGSECQHPSAFSDAIAYARKVFDLGKTFGFNMNLLDIGGGFPGHDTDESNDFFVSIADTIKQQLNDSFSDIPNLRVIAEPGRFFATSCCTLISSVIGVKKINDGQKKKYHYFINSNKYGMFNNIINDHATINFQLLKEYEGEMVEQIGKPCTNHSLGKLENKTYEIIDGPKYQQQFNDPSNLEQEQSFEFDKHSSEFSDNDSDDENDVCKLYESVVFGQTCDSSDWIAQNIMLPKLVPGNRLYATDHGAYTIASASKFNGFELPDILYVFYF